jgi:hypothetical protein
MPLECSYPIFEKCLISAWGCEIVGEMGDDRHSQSGFLLVRSWSGGGRAWTAEESSKNRTYAIEFTLVSFDTHIMIDGANSRRQIVSSRGGNSQFHKQHGNLGSWGRGSQILEAASFSWLLRNRNPIASRGPHRRG